MTDQDRAIQTIEATWLGIAPPGFGDNVHALLQGEHQADNGERGIHYPALVYASTGVGAEEQTPDGRRSNKVVETFQLDFRAQTYQQARALAESFRAEIVGGRSWSYLADDVGIDLVLSTVGDIVPRRVAELGLLFG